MNTLTFGLLTDPHIGVGEPRYRWQLYPLTRRLMRQHMDLIERTPGVSALLVAGDLTKDSESWNHFVARGVLREARLPTYIVPGNHDSRKWDSPPDITWSIHRFAEHYQGFGPRNGVLYYGVDLAPHVRLIALNSADTPDERMVNSWSGVIDDEQLTWLRGELEAHRRSRIVVLMHHNLLPHSRDDHSGTDWGSFLLENRAEVLDVLHEYGVQIVLTGHHHLNHIQEDRGLYEITTAGASTYPSCHRIFTLSGSQLTIRTVNHPDSSVALLGAEELRHEDPDEFSMPTGTHEELLTLMHGEPRHRDTALALRTL